MGRRTAASGVSAPAGGIVHAGCAPHFLFETSKRKCAAPGGKEKMFGGSVCAGADLLPPAGDSWHSLVEVRDGNARPLGKPLARGGRRIHPAPIFAAAGSSARERERQRKEKLRQYDNHPDEVGTIRHGTVVSTSQKMVACPKASPNRRLHRYADPRAHGGLLHRSAPKRPFLLDRARPVFFSARRKRKWGVHPRWTSPPAGAESPVAAVRRPAFPRGVPQKERALPFIFPQTRTRTPSR